MKKRLKVKRQIRGSTFKHSGGHVDRLSCLINHLCIYYDFVSNYYR